ncbi:MAG: hypothetical protein KDE47_12145, partial [Caldilineaceae bacterium]|nr:hypothetical protein [Caldilineaceae bacterium]
VAVHIADNDMPGVIISQQEITVTESADIRSATESYSVSLASQPMDLVTVTIAAASAFTVTPSVLHFDATDWKVPQSVSVSVKDDDVVSDRQVGKLLHTVSSNDARYAELSPVELTVDVIDNDVLGLSYTITSPLTLTEGGAPLAYQLSLESRPTADVTVTAVISNGQLTITPATFVFTPADWNTPQEGTIGAADNQQGNGGAQFDQIHFTMASADPHYNGLQQDLDVVILGSAGARTVYLPVIRKLR